MPLLRDDLPSRLLRKFCLACGYSGPELQREHTGAVFFCPQCGEDLYTRPARSYAELEGFDGADEPPGGMGGLGGITLGRRLHGARGGRASGGLGALWAWIRRLLGRR